MPAKPRWLLSIPDAISQLENLDRTLLTRRDIERLFGVSKARAATLMQTFGAEMTGNQRTLPRTRLLQQLKKHRGRAAFRGEEERRARLVTELRKARITGIRVPLPVETLNSKLASLPEGVTVERDRIEVRFSGAKNATERLYALAFALVNDYERFEALVDCGVGGGGEVVKENPAHHRAAAALDAYVEAGRLKEPKVALFQTVDPAARRLTGRALERRVVLAMIKRRPAAAGLSPSTCCHTFRATGITAYLSNGGTLEHAQQIAGHASPKTTKLYDRTADTVTVDEIERIVI